MTEHKRMIADIEWTGAMRFTAGKPGGPRIAVDADGIEAPSPVVALLIACGTCSASDVVSILEKKRIKLTRFQIEVGGNRKEDHPRRFTEIWMRFTLAGEGLTESAARQAVDLSVTKYCSVMLSLNPDIGVSSEIVIEG
jgi:putative redox protein